MEISPISLAKLEDSTTIPRYFDELEHSFIQSEDLLTDARNYLDTFLEQINIEYSTQLTLTELCKFIKTNALQLGISEEITNLISLFDSEQLNTQEISKNRTCLSRKLKKQKHSKEKINNAEGLPGQLRSNTVIGALEAAAGGAIVWLFGITGIGGAFGAAMIADGIRRIADDGQADFQNALDRRRQLTN